MTLPGLQTSESALGGDLMGLRLHTQCALGWGHRSASGPVCLPYSHSRYPEYWPSKSHKNCFQRQPSPCPTSTDTSAHRDKLFARSGPRKGMGGGGGVRSPRRTGADSAPKMPSPSLGERRTPQSTPLCPQDCERGQGSHSVPGKDPASLEASTATSPVVPGQTQRERAPHRRSKAATERAPAHGVLFSPICP